MTGMPSGTVIGNKTTACVCVCVCVCVCEISEYWGNDMTQMILNGQFEMGIGRHVSSLTNELASCSHDRKKKGLKRGVVYGQGFIYLEVRRKSFFLKWSLGRVGLWWNRSFIRISMLLPEGFHCVSYEQLQEQTCVKKSNESRVIKRGIKWQKVEGQSCIEFTMQTTWEKVCLEMCFAVNFALRYSVASFCFKNAE